MIKRLARVKKYCPLEKAMPMEQISDYIFRCPHCGYEVNESVGDSSFHKTVLTTRQSVYSTTGKKYHIKDERSRSDDFRSLNKEFEKIGRADPQSMYNPHINLQPGKNSRSGEWMSADYANLATDMNEEDLNKFFNSNRSRR